MANNNVQNVRFLRNGSPYTNRATALDGLKGQNLSIEQDGSLILARYGSGDNVKTLVGVVYAKGSNKSITIIDIEGASADVDALRTEINNKLGVGIGSGETETVTAQLTVLSGTSSSSSADTSVWGAKKYASAYTESKIDALEYTGVTEDDNKVVYNVTESDGIISANSKDISSVKLAGYTVGSDDSGKVAATDTLGEALGKLQGQINGMDKAASAEDGKVVTTVSEVDGKVSETKANVKDLQLGGYAKTNDTGDIASADTINVALSKLENKAAAITIANADGSINVTTATSGTDINVNIKSDEHVIAKDGSAGLYTNIAISAVTGTELTGLGTNVKEAYKLVGTDSSRLGEYIKIYKDSALVNFYLGHIDDKLTDEDETTHESPTTAVTNGSGDVALVYIMQLADGNYKLAAVNVESFLQESEFASGVTADSETHVVHGVVDKDSESFLTVGANGFKLAGVQDAIDTAISGLDASVSANTTHITVKVDEVDGKLTTVTLTESDIASKTDLDTLSAKTVTAVEMTGGTAAIADNTDGTKKITINTDGSKVLMTNYSKGSASGAVEITDSVNAAIGKLENQIAGKVDALDATVTGETTDGKVKVQVVQENGVLKSVTVTGTDIASESALTNEISHRKAVDGVQGDAYTADTNAHYISGVSNLYSADQALDSALNTVDNAMLTRVVAGNGIDVTDKSSKSQTISAKVKNDGGIVNDENGLHLGYIDAGEYPIA